MSDMRKLLVAAAKAANLDIEGMSFRPDDYLYGNNRFWAPLTDNADAFHLLVVLEMDIYQRRTDQEVWVIAPMRPPVVEPFGNSRSAAVRLAIVRAAATLAA